MPAKKNRSRTLLTMAVLACLAITGLLLYANALKAPFVFDDVMLFNDPHLLLTEITPDRIAGLTRITTENVSVRLIPNLTFALNYYLGRRHVPGYHLVNLLIHIATAGLVFLVCRRTLARVRDSSVLIPFLAALLWLASPLHIQSVTYTWQRMNSLAALFFMLSFHCYLQAREADLSADGRRPLAVLAYYAAAFASGLLALASKQTAVMLPVLLVLYEWFFFQDLRPAWLKKRLPWIGLAALTAAGLALFYLDGTPLKTILLSYADKPFTPSQRLLTEPRVVLFYLTLLVFPHPVRLSLDYDFPLSTGLLSPAVTPLALTALAVLIAGAAVTAKRQRLLSFALLWFTLNLLIESSLVGLDLIYGYRTYLPSIFLFAALAACLFRTAGSRFTAVCLAAAAVAVSGLWTVQHNRVWQSDLSLWRDAVQKSPLSARAHHNLGLAYKNAGACARAVDAYRRALDIRLATSGPDHYRTGETWNNLGAAYDCRGEVEHAAASYEKALAVFTRRFGPEHPRTSAVYNNLCVLYGRNDDFERAARWCRKALTVRLAALGAGHPEVADLHNNHGLALAGAGKPEAARRHLETALGIYRHHLGDQDPRTGQCRQNLARVLQQQPITSGQPEKPDNYTPEAGPGFVRMEKE